MSTDPPPSPQATGARSPRLRLDDVVRFVREQSDGVLTTLGPDGRPQASYLSLTATDRGELVLDARATSRTVRNVLKDPRVAVVSGGAGGVTLQAEGLAEEVHGEERRRCADVYRAAFPQFADSLAAPGIAVVRVRLTWARIGDYRDDAPVLRETTLPA